MELPDLSKEGIVVESVLGRGGEGIVYRCHLATDGEKTALVLKSKTCASLAEASDALQESLHMSSLSHHESLVRVVQGTCFLREHEQHGGAFYVYLGMEFCEGGDLQVQLTRDGAQFEDQVVVDYMRSLLEALRYIHHHERAHRDVKPENLFFKDGKLKLGDLGCCAVISKGVRAQLLSDVSGSFPWMAPEVLAKQGYDEKADLWSAGVVMFEMLRGSSVLQDGLVLSEQEEIDFTALRHRRDDLVELCRQLLQRDPLRRLSASAALNHSVFGGAAKSQTSRDHADLVMRPANNQDIKTMASIHAEAMQYDPRFYWFLYHLKKADRLAIMRSMDKAMSGQMLKNQHVVLQNGEPVGMMTLIPPGVPKRWNLTSVLKSGVTMLRNNPKRLAALSKFALACQKRVCSMDGVLDEYVLYVIAIRPDKQGKGIGTYMLGKMCQWAGSHRIITFVMHRSQVQLLQKFGFEVVGEFQPSPHSATVFQLVRNPQQ